MNRSEILECMYKTIKESLEWGVECKTYSAYSYFIDGVVGMTEAMLEEANKPTLSEALKEYSESLAMNYDAAGRA